MIENLCNEVITIMRQTAVSTAGDPTHESHPASANIRRVNKIIRTATGDDAAVSHELYTEDEVLPGDRIVLPGFIGLDESKPVISVQPSTDFGGDIQFYRVQL